jgi:hypothetical protein
VGFDGNSCVVYAFFYSLCLSAFIGSRSKGYVFSCETVSSNTYKL